MFRRQRGRSATAEEERVGSKLETRGQTIQLAQQCFAEALRLRGIGALFIKGAVGANTRAEGDMNVEMPNDSFFSSTLDVRR